MNSKTTLNTNWRSYRHRCSFGARFKRAAGFHLAGCSFLYRWTEIITDQVLTSIEEIIEEMEKLRLGMIS